MSTDIKKAKLLASDDLKEVGNIALEGQKVPQKAKRLQNVLLAAIRSGTNPNDFDAILPGLYRFLTQDCYVDKWKPHKITDTLSSGDNTVGDFIAEQYSKQNKAFAAPTAGISDEIWKMMIAYENNRPIRILPEVQPQNRCVLIVMTPSHLFKSLCGKTN